MDKHDNCGAQRAGLLTLTHALQRGLRPHDGRHERRSRHSNRDSRKVNFVGILAISQPDKRGEEAIWPPRLFLIYPNEHFTSSGQLFTQKFSCVAGVALRHLLWRAMRHYGAATSSAIGTHINDIVRHLDDIEIVFNDNYSVTSVN